MAEKENQSKNIQNDSSDFFFVTRNLVSTTALMDLNGDQIFEKVVLQLLDQSQKHSANRTTAALNHPFYRLLPIQRFALMGRHLEGWSYTKLGTLLNLPSYDIEKILWQTRVELGTYRSSDISIGSSLCTFQCPEYNIQRPWTQRFLDEQLRAQDRVFLQGHLLQCESCRQTLESARKIYYLAQSEIPTFECSENHLQMLSERWNAIREARVHQPLSVQKTWIPSLRTFFARKDVQVLTALGTALVIGLIFF